VAVSLVAAYVVAAAGGPASAGTGAIFMYHHVSPVVEPGPYQRALTLTPAEFDEQLRWLRTRGCVFATVDGLWSDEMRGTMAPCEVALTFDDGYADVAAYALPALERYGATATLYVATGWIGTSGHLSVAQLRNAHAAGFEIGAHTVHHVDLTKLPAAAADAEITGSMRALAIWLGAGVTSFAYPAGMLNPRVASSVAAAHFVTAVTTAPGVVRASDDAVELPRYRIVHAQGVQLLAAVLGRAAREDDMSWSALAHIARERIAGNEPQIAEALAVALLARRFPEQILRVHVTALPAATVAGIVLSGVKFHAPVTRERFEDDVRAMVGAAFTAGPAIGEVDVWAVVPVAVAPGTPVSGDYAVPTERTVFSAAVLRSDEARDGGDTLGMTYWSPGWL
jgi:peptidoglycan/xylan/chitin deacetylase (PgdA/CDA1 family)